MHWPITVSTSRMGGEKTILHLSILYDSGDSWSVLNLIILCDSVNLNCHLGNTDKISSARGQSY